MGSIPDPLGKREDSEVMIQGLEMRPLMSHTGKLVHIFASPIQCPLIDPFSQLFKLLAEELRAGFKYKHQNIYQKPTTC